MFQTAGKILSFLSLRERNKFYLLMFMIIIMALLETVGVASVMPFLTVVANPESIESNRWLSFLYQEMGFQTYHNFLVFLGLLAFFFLVVSNLFKTFTIWAKIKFVHNTNYRLSRNLLEHYLHRPYSFFLSKNSMDMGKNILTEAEQVTVGVMGTCMQLAAYFLVTLFLLIFLVIVNPLLALVTIMFLGGTYMIIYSYVRTRLAIRGQLRIKANMGRFLSAGEAFGGIKDVKFMNLENEFVRRFSSPARDYARHRAFNEVVAQTPQFTLQIIAFGGIIVVTLYLLGRSDHLGQVLPILGLYAFASMKLLPALQHIFACFSKLRFNMPALNNFYNEMSAMDMHASEPVAARSVFTGDISFQHSISLNKISFSYPGAEENTLQDLDLSIPVRSSVGLVGTTGSGKTTLVDLIMGLLEPGSGSLMVDDVPINRDNVQQWQRHIGYVPQHIFLADDTVMKNIAFGVPEKEIDMNQVVKAAKMASLHNFVQDELFRGYRTEVGERGIRLSGGQRQRIGIARALYRDPDVLIFDEATSALDNKTEKEVMQSIKDLCGIKTIIMIAHRLTTVEHCDLIYLLDKGRVRSKGSYEYLLKEDRRFQDMVMARTGTD